MAKEKKITAEKKFTLVLEQNEQLLKEIENLEEPISYADYYLEAVKDD